MVFNGWKGVAWKYHFGRKRGEAVVQMVEHEDRITYGKFFYNGKKESEIPCVRHLLKTGFLYQNISLDALHLNPETTESIHQNGGHFLIGVKDNQPELLEDLKSLTRLVKPENIQQDKPEKGHGRIDKRLYKNFTTNDLYFDKRWENSCFETLVCVERTSWNCKREEKTTEVSYYISNLKRGLEKGNELFGAVRNHWKIETNRSDEP